MKLELQINNKYLQYRCVPNAAWDTLRLTLKALVVTYLSFEFNWMSLLHLAPDPPRASLILPSLRKITVFHRVLLL